jgi:hypothetical protein
MKKMNNVLLACILLLICCSNPTGPTHSSIYGSWYAYDDIYVIFYENNTFEKNLKMFRYYGTYSYEPKSGKGFLVYDNQYKSHESFKIENGVLSFDLFDDNIYRKR